MTLTRRSLLAAAALGALAQAAPVAWPRRLAAAAAAAPDLVADTLNGLVAWVVPGDDRYSRAQGTHGRGDGGIGFGTTRPLMAMLDFLESDARADPVPQSPLIAAVLNGAAEHVHPNPPGDFPSAFSRLSFDEKRAAFEEIDSDPALASAHVLLTLLPGAVAVIAYSEAPVVDLASGRLRHTPGGWRASRYGGPADGRPELIGFYAGRRRASG